MSDPVDVSRGNQTYCDWCYGDLTATSIQDSERVGLHREFAWACRRCLDERAYLRPPEGWDQGLAAWPWHTAG